MDDRAYHQHYTSGGKIIPNKEDYEAIERECGPLAAEASTEKAAYRYQLAQAHKMIRLFGSDSR
jgi:hypothetical protein